jgi:mannan endo-1,4-beta-mannosidase
MRPGRLGQAAAALAPVVLAAAVGLVLISRGTAPPPHTTRPAPPRPSPSQSAFRAGAARHWLNGVALARYTSLAPFEQATGEHPGIVEIYVNLAAPYPVTETRVIVRGGAIPLIQIIPRQIPLAAITAGRYDAVLREWATAIRSAGQPVIISFAHEQNGPWFSWGCDRTRPAVYIAAWRHVHDVIGTRHVTWLWNVNETWPRAPCGLFARYPGSAYVNWVGIDGYLRAAGNTFARGLGRTITILRSRLSKPVLIAEAGVTLGPGAAARIASLYGGARAAGCLGVVYFDSATRKGDYRPQDRPAALAAFRAALNAPALLVPGRPQFAAGNHPADPIQGGNTAP